MFRAAWVLTKHTFRGYGRANSALYAAAIAYYVLFSIVPLAILAFSAFGIVLRDEGRREEIVDYVLDQLPLTQTEGRQDVGDILNSVQAASGAVAIIGVVVALWTASSVFSAIRRALNNVWRVDEVRPFAQGKLVDFLQIGLLSAILLASLVATGVVRAVREDDVVAATLGKNVLWARVRIFAIGGALIGLAGSLHAFYYQYIDPTQFSTIVIAYAFMAVIAGGRGAHLGTVAGAAVVMILLEGSRFAKELIRLEADQLAAIRIIIVGVGLILLLIYRPHGFLREYRLQAPLREARREPQPQSPKEATT